MGALNMEYLLESFIKFAPEGEQSQKWNILYRTHFFSKLDDKIVACQTKDTGFTA